MKIYTRIVIDMDTLETIEEDSYEYSGPVGLCMSGGGDDGGGDSGGSSGTAGGGASAGFGGASNPGSMGGGNTAGSGLGGFGGGPGGSVGGAGGGGGGGGGSVGGAGGSGQGIPNVAVDTSGLPSKEAAAAIIGNVYGGIEPGTGLAAGNTTGKPAAGKDDAAAVAMGLGKTGGSTLVNTLKFGLNLLNPRTWGNLPDNAKNAIQNAQDFQSWADAVSKVDWGGAFGGLSSGVGGGAHSGGGGGNGGNDPVEATGYLAGLSSQNAAAGLGAPTGLEAIIKSLYAGNDPQFNLPQMMGDYTTRITGATDQFDAAAQAMTDDWKEYEAQVFGIEDDYNQQMNNLPRLDMILPTGMGGGSVPLAPGAWAALAGDQASRRADILSQALPAMANRANIPMNRYSTQMGSAEALMRPFDTAMDIYELDKRIQGNLDVAEASKPDDDDGSIWDSLIPAAGYALGSWLD